MTGLRAITIRPPWTVPILTGVKTVENRRQNTHWRGRLAIHTSRTWCPAGQADPRVNAAAWAPQVDPAIRDLACAPGAVVALAELVDCHRADGRCCPDWGDHDVWHLILHSVTALAGPVPACGALGIWTPSPTLAAAIIAANPARLAQPDASHPPAHTTPALI